MLKEGRVIRKIQGYYFVYTNHKYSNIEEFENGLIKCKLKGTLKEKNKKDNCVIGDIVIIDTENEIIVEIKERKNLILRPLMSNVDNIVIVFSSKEPHFDIVMFQKYLIYVHKNNINPILLISKSDLLNEEEINEMKEILDYNFPYLKYYFTSIKRDESFIEFKKEIENKNIIIIGQSGVGKSSLVNYLLNVDILKVGEISKKTLKGKNTTIDTRFFPYNKGYIIDTPGFSSVEFPIVKDILEIKEYMPEIKVEALKCKFNNCIHITEPNCSVKNNLTKLRYDFYNLFLNNIR